MIVSCGQCGVKLKVDETKIKEGGSKLKCPKCANIFIVMRPQEPAPEPQAPQMPQAAPEPPPVAERPAPAPPETKERPERPVRKWELNPGRIVVGHDGDSTLRLMESLLTQAGYEVTSVSEGVEAVVAIEREKPFLAILDVALPRIYGFEICDRLKNSAESRDVKVILIASIYDKTRYKREPMSLYGADDYIEKHHIQDCLVQKIQRLATGRPEPGQRPVREEQYIKTPPDELPARQEQAVQMRKEEMPPVAGTTPEPEAAEAPPSYAPSVPAAPVDGQQVEAARRFARIILSDIALYNQGAVEEGIRGGNFEEVLSAELREGRDLYNNRVPEEVRRTMDYYADEIRKFIDKKKQTMQLG